MIVFSAQEDEQVLVNALEAGASGDLSKGSPLVDLIDATRAVHRGDALIPPRMLGALLQRLVHRRRERDEALKQMAKPPGGNARSCAARAGRGQRRDRAGPGDQPETARTHIQNVLGKLGVHSRLEAAAFVTQNGILDDLAGAAR